MNRFYYITLCYIHNNDYKVLQQLISKWENVTLLSGIDELCKVVDTYSVGIMLGFHGKANSGGRFDHTFRKDILNFYFGESNIGEVGAFYRWMEMNGINVIFVSGEGNFDDELDTNNVVIYHSNTRNSTQIEEEYRLFLFDLSKSLELCILSKIKIGVWPNEPIYVQFDNLDKYTIISKTNINIKIINNMLYFKSLNDFFFDLIKICKELNIATKKIIQRNIKLCNIIRKKEMDISIEGIDKYLCVPIHLLTEAMWTNIFQKLGINYEDY